MNAPHNGTPPGKKVPPVGDKTKGGQNSSANAGYGDGPTVSSKSAYDSFNPANIANIPPELLSGKRLVCWRVEMRGGKPTKVPVNPRTGRDAKSNDSSTWGTLDEALAYYKAHPDVIKGIGRMFAEEDNMTGIDCDGCLDELGFIISEHPAAKWLPKLNSYCEDSPSRRGVKVWVYGRHPFEGKTGRKDQKLGIEIYSHRRFFTLTGNRLKEFSAKVETRQDEINAFCAEYFNAKHETCEQGKYDTATENRESDDEIIRRAKAAKNGDKFSRLWDGDTEGYPSPSEADAALSALLWFWTGDREQVCRLFGHSELGKRSKWDDRPDYQRSTLDFACRGETYCAGTDVPGIEGDSGKPLKKSAASEMVEMADKFPLFHDAQGKAFARIELDGHTEIWPVASKAFRKLLAHLYYKEKKKTLRRDALLEAISTLEGKAMFECPEEPIFLRVAWHGKNILIDLCDDEWRVVEVTPDGWSILDESPVAFIRTSGMRPLPEPKPGGSITPLWDLVNVSEDQRPLMAAALLNHFHPDSSYGL